MDVLQEVLLRPRGCHTQGTTRQREGRGASGGNEPPAGVGQHWERCTALLTPALASWAQLGQQSPVLLSHESLRVFRSSWTFGAGRVVVRCERAQLGCGEVTEAGTCSCSLRTWLQSPFPSLVLSSGVGCCDLNVAEGQRGRPGQGPALALTSCCWGQSQALSGAGGSGCQCRVRLCRSQLVPISFLSLF